MNQAQGPIERKLIAALNKQMSKKIIDLADLRDGKALATALQATTLLAGRLTQLDPLHALIAHAQNQQSVLIEQLSEFDDLAKFTKDYEEAVDIYMPSGPPMSPLTNTYFTYWAANDMSRGLKRETLGRITIAVCKALKADKTLIDLLEAFQRSRMGVYLHLGDEGRYIRLRELVTGKVVKCFPASGYVGSKGELWYARIFPLPPILEHLEYTLVLTTPYVLLEENKGKLVDATEQSWLAFFERNLPKANGMSQEEIYESFMKYGPSKNYWNEYVFEGYYNFTPNAIWLAGFPDIDASRPHSNENSFREIFP